MKSCRFAHSVENVYVEDEATTTALHSLVEEVKDTFKEKEALVNVFMEIEGALDSIAYESMEAVLERIGVSSDAIKWIVVLLKSCKLKVEQNTAVKRIQSLQRLTSTSITGAMSSSGTHSSGAGRQPHLML
ncbi:hypothetical protein J6590_068289 [Homalodisca vitripennis]|nr:hypothetical protein J6590_068289 [Homalodisca vitripennis]